MKNIDNTEEIRPANSQQLHSNSVIKIAKVISDHLKITDQVTTSRKNMLMKIQIVCTFYKITIMVRIIHKMKK